jgi:hypothetical protein
VTLIDRLVHRAEILPIEGDSYRLKEAQERTARKNAARSVKLQRINARRVFTDRARVSVPEELHHPRADLIPESLHQTHAGNLHRQQPAIAMTKETDAIDLRAVAAKIQQNGRNRRHNYDA